MKKSIKIFAFLTIFAVVLAFLSVSAFAADSSVTFEGHDEGFDFAPGSEYTATDLFDNFKNCMPGDTLTETITVKNESPDSDYIKMFVRALPHDEENNPLSENISKTETVASMEDFLSKLHIKVYNGDELIFDASPDTADGLSENVLLGTFRKGDSTTLTVKLSVPADLSNDYAHRVGEVDWVFLTEAFDDPAPPKDDDDLIQTGALFLPIPVLSVVGASMIALGAIFTLKKKENENA